MARKGPLRLALDASLRKAPPEPSDVAVVALARGLAGVLDAARPDEVADPRFVAVWREYRMLLVELGLTPAARGKAAKADVSGDGVGGEVSRAVDALSRLRARRAGVNPA